MQNEENKVKKSFFQGVKSELKKVVWPTARQTSKNTLVTIVFVLLISIILGLLNLLFNFVSSAWYDLILGKNKTNNARVNQVVISGELSGETETSESTEVEGEPISGELAESESTEEAETSEPSVGEEE